ncbi:diacylglycerol/lipid kinase family protein [Nocardia sp. NPDC003482]
MRIAVIVNPAAGGNPFDLIDVLTAEHPARAITVHPTAGRGDGEKLAYDLATAADRPDAVVAVGGDGTVGEVVAGLHRATSIDPGTDPALVVAPGGTGNSNYRGLWDDLPWPDVARMLRDPAAVRERRIDLLHVDELDRAVLLGSATGVLPAALTAAATLPLRGRERLLTATLTALTTFRPFRVRVTLDGRPFADTAALVTNVSGFRHRGGLLRLMPRSVLDDGLLDVLVVTADAEVEPLVQAVLAGDITEIPGVHYAQGKHVTIERTDGEPITFEHDGELRTAATPNYAVTVLPHALKVLVPADTPPWFTAAE